jgi:serine/threonine-protein kinase
VPGALLVDRFRIVGLLGRGGMGEVYRADDLKLDQPVALKFLPEALQEDAERLERFYGEVRLARQISHPSICRVYDVVDADGTPFLSMEYVDGEDLASLLRRIGRLPRDKALEIARQLCAGLAAAHEKGVLHRDLKPENVMVDGRGHVRITDFGLAVAADAVEDHDVRSGTPAYMSPEQLAGLEVTVRSDVYALGLVLYELFTGRKAFDARSLSELERMHREQPPPPPSEIVPDLDPAVERAILRCLEKEPRDRPPSAVSVAAALPGGDPLAAALAAGETPSPELVAAAGATAGLNPRLGLIMLLVSAAIVATSPLLTRPLHLHRRMAFDKPPVIMEDRAREVLVRLGHAEAPVDTDRGFAVDMDYLHHVTRTDSSPGRWDRLGTGQPPVLTFWYRQSPRPLVPDSLLGEVSSVDPPPLVSGMSGVRFDTRGRLVAFYSVPPQVEPSPAPGHEGGRDPDWEPLFAEAGLDPEAFREVEPRWTPPFFCDTRAAWEGVFPDRPEIPVRVEAAGYRGRPVSFQLVAPWTRAERMMTFPYSAGQRAAMVSWLGVLLGVIVVSALVARRHLRLGRGDRPGAQRVAAGMGLVAVVGWVVFADHVFAIESEVGMAIRGLGVAALIACVTWTLYLALEPYVRRRWPHALISWTRLLGGRVRDPLVGRDVLLGITVGLLVALLICLVNRLPAWTGHPAAMPTAWGVDLLLGWKVVVAEALFGTVSAAAMAMALLLVLLLFRVLLRRFSLAVLAALLLMAVPDALASDLSFWIVLPVNMLLYGLLVLVLARFGLLAGIVSLFIVNRSVTFPLATDLSRWDAAPTLWLVGLVAGLALYAFRTATAGRALLGPGLLRD